MAYKSAIEWCEGTWNYRTGCTPISEGCENCYAKRTAETRLRGKFGYPADDPFRPIAHPDKFDQPLHWRKPRMVFVSSMGDLFHEAEPIPYRGQLGLFEVPDEVVVGQTTSKHTISRQKTGQNPANGPEKAALTGQE